MEDDSKSAARHEQRAEPLIRLASWVRRRSQQALGRTFVIGIVGLPGCGKSTLAEQLVWALPQAQALTMPRALTVSLDDFYLTAEERRAVGRELRGPPGTHDLRLLDRLLDEIASRATTLHLPVFDRQREQRLPSRQVAGPLDIIIFEGWFLGARSPGYERLADALELLIYIDMSEAEARAARLSREAALQQSGRAAMSEAEVIRFWDTSLAPYFATLVLPLRERADAIVSLDGAHHITRLELDRCDPCRAPQAADRVLPPAPSGDGNT